MRADNLEDYAKYVSNSIEGGDNLAYLVTFDDFCSRFDSPRRGVHLPAGKTKYIHINQHVIKRNAKTGERAPVVTCKTYNSNHYGHEVELHDGGSVVYRPDKPLACGAKVWIVTKGAVTISYEVHI